MVYIFYTIFTILLLYYQKYQFLETRAAMEGKIPKLAQANKMWHRYGLAIRIFVIAIFGLHFLPVLAPSIYDIFLAGAINILLFEFGTNKIVLNKDWFYVGVTAETDKKLGKMKWKVFFGIFFIALVMKIISLF